MKVGYLITIIGTAVVLSSCASVSRGSKEDFTISTDPPGVEARFSDGFSCTTPCSMKRKHKTKFIITLVQPGYNTVDVYIDSRASKGGVSAATAGNILIGGLVGLGVDAITGAMRKLAPNPVHVVMEPGDGFLRLAAPRGTEDLYEVPEGVDFKAFVKGKDDEETPAE